jgi:hypothetical protein
MPRWRPKYKDEQQDNELGESPLEILRKRLYSFLNLRLGRPAAAVVLAIVAVWAGWDGISKLPGIDGGLIKSHELFPVPKAQGDRFAITVAT